jgi:hypothetical protein
MGALFDGFHGHVVHGGHASFSNRIFYCTAYSTYIGTLADIGIQWDQLLSFIDPFQYLPVVPHKAAAQVSQVGNHRRGELP